MTAFTFICPRCLKPKSQSGSTYRRIDGMQRRVDAFCAMELDNAAGRTWNGGSPRVASRPGRTLEQAFGIGRKA
jgi:hypothetical protein